MDRAIWERYRKAKGAARKKLSDQLLAENDALAQAYSSAYVRSTQYYTEELREDLLQAARIGLMRALDGWDPDKGTFGNCAFFWARHEMQFAVRMATSVSVPKDAFLPRAKQDAAARFAALNGREPTPAELGITEVVADRARKASATFAPLSAADALTAGAANALEPEAIIDRKRDAAALNAFIRSLSKKDQREFWSGNRPDLTAKAKKFIEDRRTPCRMT